MASAVAGSSAAEMAAQTPWTGNPGLTVTIAEIMARDAAFAAPDQAPGEPKEPKVRLFADRKHLRENPDSPAVAQWPAPETIRAAAGVGPPGPKIPQTAGVSFLAAQLSESGFIPPDTQAAAGPSQIFLCLNGRFKVFDKRGVLGALNTTSDNFFGSVTTQSTTDPHVRYDRLSGRWYVIMVDIPSSRKNNHVLIAVSDGPVISSTSSFTFFSFQQNTVNPSGDNNLFADYPTLGIDNQALYIGANMFSSSSFSGTTGFVINKADLLAGQLTVTAFRRLATSTQSGPFTPQGVDNDDPAATEGYFIGVDTRSKGRLVVRRVSNPGGSPSISGNLNVTVPTTVNALGGVIAKGASTPLDDLDDRLFAARMHAGSLWTAHNIEVDSSGNANSGGGRDGSRWYEIINLTGTPTLRQSGTLFDPAASNPASYWIPSCAMSGQGHMALGCSVAGPNEFAEIAVAGRFASDPLGTLQAPTIAQTSSTSYDVGTQNPRRWGDFSLVTVDPSDNMTLWTAQEYCNAVNSWGVRVIQLLAPPPATPTNISPSSVAAGSSNVTVVVSGLVVNGSGFFDPGAGFSNHIGAAVNGGGVIVNNVTYSDPTHLTLNLTVLASATNSSRTMTITNPDGQSITSPATLFAVSGGNTPPMISSIAAQAINEDQSSGLIGFTVDDAETPASSLTLSGRSSNTALIPNGNILFGGSGSNRTVTVVPAANQFGPATITVTVADSMGGTNSTSFALTVNSVNDAPSFVNGGDVTVPEDAGPQSISAWATSISSGPSNEVSETLNFLVSSDNNSLFSSPPAISASGTLTFASATNASGTATIVAQLFDNGGTANGGVNSSAQQTFTITVTPVNDPPVAHEQSVVTDEDTPAPVTLTGSDIEGAALTYTVLTGPVHGVLSGTGSHLMYQPATNYFGADAFTFKVNDGDLDSAPATVTIAVNPVNDPPVANVQSVTTSEDTALAITLTGSDVEGDALSYTIVAMPDNGSLSGTAPNVTYHPNTNFFGTDSFSFKVSDGDLDSAPATVTITVNSVNDPPVLLAIQGQVVDEGATLTFTNQVTDVDVPTETFTFSLDPGAPDGAAIDPANGVFTWTPTEAQGPATNTIVVRVTDDGSPSLSATQSFTVIVREVNSAPRLSPVADQTAVVGTTLAITNMAADDDIPANALVFSLDPGAPDGAAIDPLTGVFTWTPTASQASSNTVITVRVTDDGSPPMSDSRSFMVVVSATNAPPSLAAIPNQTVYANTVVTFTVSASDPNLPEDVLTFSLDAGAPSGASLNPTNGLFNWQPTDSAIGTNAFTVSVTDGGAPPLSDTTSFQIRVVGQPVIESVAFAGDNVIVRWSAVSGKVYQVEYKTNLEEAAWNTLPGDVTATGESAEKLDALAPSGRRYYRILVVQ